MAGYDQDPGDMLQGLQDAGLLDVPTGADIFRDQSLSRLFLALYDFPLVPIDEAVPIDILSGSKRIVRINIYYIVLLRTYIHILLSTIIL